MGIKNQFEKTEKLYHFTSFNTALEIIESNQLRFGRLNYMNDIHENDKIVFVDGNSNPIDKLPPDVLDTLYDEIYKYRQISLTIDNKDTEKNGFDLHQMWGMYADKGEGVCLVFDKKKLDKSLDMESIISDRVEYKKNCDLESFFSSSSQTPNEVQKEIETHINKIFFYKREEWEHEQEYRLLKRCPNPIKEEYLSLGQALKFVILSSKLIDKNEVIHFKKIRKIKDKVDIINKGIKSGKAGSIPVLIYGNGLFNYSLRTEDGEEEVWNSQYSYKIPVVGKNYELDS